MLGQTDRSTDTILGGVAQWLAAFGMNEVNARRARLAPAEIEFGVSLALNYDIWWQQF